MGKVCAPPEGQRTLHVYASVWRPRIVPDPLPTYSTPFLTRVCRYILVTVVTKNGKHKTRYI
jgi:hypothetical protein